MWSAGAFGTYEAFTAGEWTTPMFPGMDNISSFSTPQQVNHTTSLGCIEDSIALPTPSKLNFKEVRKRALSTHLRSPFLFNTRSQDEFKKFMKSKSKRNVGLTYGVGFPFFEDLQKKNSELTDGHINSYLALLHADPTFVGLRFVRPGIVLTSTDFMEGIRGVWKNYHPLEITTATTYDFNTEEDISEDDLKGLLEYISGHIPGWFPLKPWYDYEKLVFVDNVKYNSLQLVFIANVGSHWVTLQVDFVEHVITLWDSTRHNWDNDTFTRRFKFFLPLTRILPRLLMYCGYWDAHPELTPLTTQWRLFAPSTSNHYKQNDGYTCGLYALKYVEMLLSNSVTLNMSDKDLFEYRYRITTTIFKFSTPDEN
ncbi:hypothetical protein C2S52_014254 [Perilla frutescens var. hirtella]|nr:hypothetical protein C2S52_014254 [Perilla frutescens var. hirtella]